jgi:hypothetical protein
MSKSASALVIAVATAVTYQIVFDSATRRDLRHLETHVIERARQEEIGLPDRFREDEVAYRVDAGTGSESKSERNSP